MLEDGVIGGRNLVERIKYLLLSHSRIISFIRFFHPLNVFTLIVETPMKFSDRKFQVNIFPAKLNRPLHKPLIARYLQRCDDDIHTLTFLKNQNDRISQLGSKQLKTL